MSPAFAFDESGDAVVEPVRPWITPAALRASPRAYPQGSRGARQVRRKMGERIKVDAKLEEYRKNGAINICLKQRHVFDREVVCGRRMTV